MKRQYLTVHEVALACKVSIVCVDQWIATGQLYAELRHDQIMIRTSDVQLLLQKMEARVTLTSSASQDARIGSEENRATR